MIDRTPAEIEQAFPELFKVARQCRARCPEDPGAVRMHTIRLGDIDPQTGQGGEPVRLVQPSDFWCDRCMRYHDPMTCP